MGSGKSDENFGADYRRRILRGSVGGFGSAPRNKKNNEIRQHAKSRNWQRANRLCLKQSLCQFQRMSPDFYFSKFHSEVTSATHTPAQKGVRKGAPLFSDSFFQSRLPCKSRLIPVNTITDRSPSRSFPPASGISSRLKVCCLGSPVLTAIFHT